MGASVPLFLMAAEKRVACLVGLLSLAAQVVYSAPAVTNAPFAYVWARAYHVLPETTSEESGYFSLSEGLDGSVYVGTAKYNENAFLVAFDPETFEQRVVLDTHKVCGLNASGYAAQAKIHTRNFVGASGALYVGSKQGYRLKGDPSTYPGGYVMRYDPRTGAATQLGMPYAEQGVIDVTADESRGLLYVVTCEDQHWMLGGMTNGVYRELGPLLTPYATTLIDRKGRAYAVTRDFELARYDPACDEVTVRPIRLDGKPFVRRDNLSIPTWVLAPDGHTAYMILLNDPALISLDLECESDSVAAVSHGRMVEGKHPDSRCALSIGPEGRVYAVVRVDNDTGFGSGYLHHLARFDPATGTSTDLGVLAVRNVSFFDFDAGAPHAHGYHTLPDGTLTPLHHHLAMTVGRDGVVYVTILYPFTVLRIDAFRTPAPAAASPADRYLDAVLDLCGRAEARMAEFVALGERVADRHIRGGAIGTRWANQALGPELLGRAGGMVHIGFNRPWRKDRTDAEKANDVALFGFERSPDAGDRLAFEAARDRGCLVVGFGARRDSELAAWVEACDVFVDSGNPEDDGAVELADGSRAGRLDPVANVLHGWLLMAETVAALTRQGRMPAMWKSYSYPDGKEWGARYLGKKQFHDEFDVPPVRAGTLARAYLERIRYHVRRLKRLELDDLREAGRLIAEELGHGRKTVVAWAGHMAEGYVGKGDDVTWCQPVQLHLFLEAQREKFRKRTEDGALVLRLGYHGLDPLGPPLFREKRQRLIVLAGENPDPAWQPPADAAVSIDLGWAFGDACVTVDGYPFPLFPPSGVMQAVAYEAIHAEVSARRRVIDRSIPQDDAD